ncbi:hypothetical protein NDU88_006570 [Pleurodeles waltl]|uniref:Uncharacterized protein n=1 Tax=Pleurodeles waltl TaxID=8319 RepID=A0AAV7ULD6_PLEWA|nr:hypothetical protein NDU88_006570 [Pleurodeles waltl]
MVGLTTGWPNIAHNSHHHHIHQFYPSGPSNGGTVDPASAARPGPSNFRAAGQSSGQTTTPTPCTSASTQTAAAPPIDPAAFLALNRKMDRFITKVDKLSQDVAYIKKRVRSIRRTLRRANL